MGVMIEAGSIALTLTREPNSTAMARVIPLMAALVVAYATNPGFVARA